MNRLERIEKLLAELNPVELEITDDSEAHAGHAGASGGEFTHLTINISSPVFLGKSMVEQHRIIYNLLGDELKNGLHALKLNTSP